MGTLQADTEEKHEMDDSGCIQDESPPMKCDSDYYQQVQLLDLSDDVLLLILKHLAPEDLKALGFTCPRLGALVLDRSLWHRVDTRAQPSGRVRLLWLLAHALHSGTRELLLAGYAREAKHCLGHVNQTREDMEEAAEKARRESGTSEQDNNSSISELQEAQGSENAPLARIIELPTLGASARLYIEEESHNTPETWAWPSASEPLVSDSTCPGPQFTLTQCVMRQLTDTCCHLESLGLDYCNINCSITGISHFPPTLKKLSLRGSKCYNLPMDRSFLFKIQDYLPDLETLDVCECDWMEPASLLPLSKLPRLSHLYMRDCHRMTEFVAYASLATRYGFIKLQCLDLRGSPVGDSEVSALGWLASLRELRLSPSRPPSPRPQHSHHKRDALPPPEPPLHSWEHEEPEYYKFKMPLDFYVASKEKLYQDSLQQKWSGDPSAPGRHVPYDPCDVKVDDNPPKPRPSRSNKPGPSKRKRDGNGGNSSDDEDVPLKCLIKKRNSDGASTSRQEPHAPHRQAEPRHHVLYVNVGQQLHAVYRLSLDNEHIFSFRRQQNARRINPRNVFLNPPTLHLDSSSLVTDSAVRRFGRADGEDINYVHIGPNGPYANMPGARPNRSSLRYLSITGFRHITDRSLTHLATAAPELEYLDFSETNVTEQGVESFRSIRPDCQVIYSPYKEKKED